MTLVKGQGFLVSQYDSVSPPFVSLFALVSRKMPRSPRYLAHKTPVMQASHSQVLDNDRISRQ